ncbi:MAG: hypothetical protein ABII00_03300 [Elusimicrobiota bacterium]
MNRFCVATVVMTLTLAVASGVHAKPSKPAKGKAAVKMKILSFTGKLGFMLPDGKVVSVDAGAPIPEIPEGAEIVVLSGEALFEAGGVIVRADEGDSFTFDASAGAVQIAATGKNTSLRVTAGGTEAIVGSGDAISVTSVASGRVQLTVVSGDVTLVQDGGTRTLTAGDTADVELPVPEALGPPPAVEPGVSPQPVRAEDEDPAPAKLPDEEEEEEEPQTEELSEEEEKAAAEEEAKQEAEVEASPVADEEAKEGDSIPEEDWVEGPEAGPTPPTEEAKEETGAEPEPTWEEPAWEDPVSEPEAPTNPSQDIEVTEEEVSPSSPQ